MIALRIRIGDLGFGDAADDRAQFGIALQGAAKFGPVRPLVTRDDIVVGGGVRRLWLR